jgi:phosphatidylglycerol:prolipoprotein diacylglycerol transferase
VAGPQIPHIDLPEIPIPAVGVVVLLVGIAIAFVVSQRNRPWDFTAVVWAAVLAFAPVAFWFYVKPNYFDAGEPPTVKPFGTLVALGVYIGSVVAVRHGRQRGLDVDRMNSFIFWVVGLGFVGGHVLDAVFYTPEKLASDPLYLVKIWAGLSSFGGFTGAIIGAVAYKLVKKDDVLAYVDTVCSAFPLAWVFGRSGCASVHDHPGKLSDAWFAVKCVEHTGHSEGPAFLCRNTDGLGRFDLGLIEMVLTIPLAIAFAVLWARRPRQYGFFAGWMCILYAPVRFVLDFFRAGPGDKVMEVDPRHAGLTPAQWACFGLVALGFYIVHLGKAKYPPMPATYAELQARAAENAPHSDEDADEEEEEERRAPRREAVAKKAAIKSAPSAPAKGKKSKKKAKRPARAEDAESNGGAKTASTEAAADVGAADDAEAPPRAEDASDDAPREGDA